MISRRQYFSIVLIFIAVFLMFQGTQASKSLLNPYDTNTHTEDASLRSEDAYSRGAAARLYSETPRPYALFIGPEDSTRARIAQEWADYAKMDLRFAGTVPRKVSETNPVMLLLDTDALAENAEGVELLADAGVSVVCMGLPRTDAMESDDRLRELLGIRDVWTESVELHGVHLFSGFFLGGERIYEPEKPEEEKLQDLELTYPWYRMGAGVKVYLQGILDETQARAAKDSGVTNEQLPALIWRVSRAPGAIYVVPAPFMDDACVGMGVLSAVAAQASNYHVYPVVNARVISVLNFPIASDENGAVMETTYGRSQTNLGENVILPMLVRLAAKNHLRLTCCMAPQYDYTDDALPLDGVADLYLGRFNETDTEMGLSLLRREGVTLREKLDADDAYFQGQELNYRFSAVCAGTDELDTLRSELNVPPLDALRTVLADYQSDRFVLSYLDADVTLQQIMQRENSHTYSQDLRLLGLETALGYSNSCFDMAQAMWPDSSEEEWQNVSEEIFANMITYSKPFAAFDNLTASESDARVRRFLALDYATTRTGDRVTISMDNFNQEAYFVLRTFGEGIESISGGTWTQIEQNAFLIKAEQAEVNVLLQQAETPNYR